MSFVRLVGFTDADYEKHADMYQRWQEEQQRLNPGAVPDGTQNALDLLALILGIPALGAAEVILIGGGIYLCTVPGGLAPGIFCIVIGLAPIGGFGLKKAYDARRVRQEIISGMGLCFKCGRSYHNGDERRYTPGRGLHYHRRCPDRDIMDRLRGFCAAIPIRIDPEDEDSDDEDSDDIQPL